MTCTLDTYYWKWLTPLARSQGSRSLQSPWVPGITISPWRTPSFSYTGAIFCNKKNMM
ncbi:hypothetical protein DPMN_119686 [Dreissena polymorpha]|uniref:Uncharacterized protein n=1 Tax=Dreissena polymorpha TaxID=45954 RepID=A0A9D4JMZ7_DREPO|nr:hypothetical protein DPMN_119686 [Dreissena polymorpha]